MNRIHNLSIRWKLMFVILLTSILGVVFACAILLSQELAAFRRTMVREMTVLADVLGKNSTAAVSFGDETAARQTLSALRAEPHVVAAALYAGRGNTVFAEYVRAGAGRDLPPRAPPDGHRFGRDRLALSRPIELNGRRLGTILVQADLGGVRERFRSFALIAGVALLCTALVTLGLSAWLQRLVSAPILALASTARSVAQSRDYSARARQYGSDETGQLCAAFNQMLAEIQARQTALQRANDSLLEQADQVTRSVGVLSASVGEMSALSTQLAAGAAESATAVAQTTATVDEIRQGAEAASQKARQVADGAQQVAQVSRQGRESTEAALEGMKRIQHQMESIAESMVRLSEQTQAIGQIIASVDDLAAQSNLLAVNAAIEAAKAGEHGKGFAVVAQEVRNLAEQSRQATGRVRTLLHDIQKATGAAVMATEQGARVVEAGVNQSVQAGESIATLAGSVAESAQAAAVIAASSQQQVVGMEQVAAAMASVRQTSGQNLASAKHLEAAAQGLNELGRRLRALADKTRG